MDQREKIDDFEETLRVAIEGMLLDVMTSMPVRIISFDATEMTCSAQPLLQSRVQAQDGTYAWTNQAVLIHAPVVFMSGGGFTITAPPRPGQEALAIFSSREIDNWWLAGGIQKRNDLRSHDLSDGFILVGPRSKPNVLANINPDAMEIRNDDSSVVLSMAESGITMTAPAIAAEANGGTAAPLATQAFMAWVVAALAELGYTGAPPPANSLTTVFKAE
jgi:hypothetical protein